MEAKRMRFNSSHNSNHNEKLELKIWQNLQLSKCYDDNYINRLLESTRSVLELVSTTELRGVENEAVRTAINTFGLKKPEFDLYEDSSDDSDQPSTSSQSSSRQNSNNSVSSIDTTLESEAINSAICSYGLQKGGI
ncbi:CLUMA_CG002367, isoform A [Clunio marinus]|uniref:CLUMA_CG002367, isoform A n=1 Tax=Clunio marinus TaxID=568069 RepID=A0A1J1HMP9_9DIPT|nr:CLUMA_CG002367, isoform A [Clunio marinus]